MENQTQDQLSVNQQTSRLTYLPPTDRRIHIGLLLAGLVLVASIVVWGIQMKNQSSVAGNNQASYAQSADVSGGNFSTDTTTAGPVNKITSSYTFDLPDGYEFLEATDDTRTYGFGDSTYLTITQGMTVDLDKLSPTCQVDAPGYCLDEGVGWGQTEKVMNLTLDGVPARSFYISAGVDNAYHVVQTTAEPIVELKMYVAGGGLDATFQKILNSFKFVAI